MNNKNNDTTTNLCDNRGNNDRNYKNVDNVHNDNSYNDQ